MINSEELEKKNIPKFLTFKFKKNMPLNKNDFIKII